MFVKILQLRYNKNKKEDGIMAEIKRAPAIFIGHGSPMNAIETNRFSTQWANIGKLFDKPKAIVVISAHWFSEGTRINDELQPKLIYDMYGFPKELYQVQYPACNSPAIVNEIKSILKNHLIVDNQWGYDHGIWSVLHHMYPQADIPIVPLSIDYNLSPKAHYQLGRKLRALRDQGVMILGSGNVVHNLALVDWGMKGGYQWATHFDSYIKRHIENRNFTDVIQYQKAGPSAQSAFYTPEHFYPLLYVLGAAHEEDSIQIINEDVILGAISMTSYLFIA